MAGCQTGACRLTAILVPMASNKNIPGEIKEFLAPDFLWGCSAFFFSLSCGRSNIKGLINMSMLKHFLRKTISIRDTAVRTDMKEDFYHGVLFGILGVKA
ncbi:MAG: hypothetical protein HFI88_00140 [Lachnospiraceae bacterium]|nr:hypothetical protein [Lachnospiraceae bacterium]